MKELKLIKGKPWQNELGYFRTVHITPGALGKMVNDACAGKAYEVMGLVFGYIISHGFMVTDSVCLPVEGTETRVNAGDDAQLFAIEYTSRVERNEKVIGWYHSHPGYRPWLSGIDVRTQEEQQLINDPMIAIVIDPLTTVESGEVDIGAFRVYTDCERSKQGLEFRQQMKLCSQLNDPNISDTRKEADYGNHREDYYSLEVKRIDKVASMQPLILEESNTKSGHNNIENMKTVARIIKASSGLCSLGKNSNEIKIRNEISDSLRSRHF